MSEEINCIDIEPLEPPFKGTVLLHFEGEDKMLAVSPQDYAKLCKLLGTNVHDRIITLSVSEDKRRIRITVCPS